MSTEIRPVMVAEPGVRFGIANGLIVAVLCVAALAHLTGAQTEFLTVLVAGLACCGLSRLLTAGVGVAAWAMFTGFVVNSHGMLTLGHRDVLRLAAFALVTGVLAITAHRIHATAGGTAHGLPGRTARQRPRAHLALDARD